MLDTIIENRWFEGLALMLVSLGVGAGGRRLLVKFKEHRSRRLAKDQLQERVSGRTAIDITSVRITAFFAAEPQHLEDVLAIRASYFGKTLVSSEASYRNSYNRNQMIFRIVAYDDRAMAYWGLMPVSADSFEAFCRGELSHEEMLSERCIAWDDADPQGLYLYVIGAVTPWAAPGGEALLRTDRGVLSTLLMEDLFGFAKDLLDRYSIAGIAGYPSRERGRRWFDAVPGLEIVEGVNVGGVDSQLIYAARGDVVDRLKYFLRARDKFGVAPVWATRQKRSFHKAVGRRLRPESSGAARRRAAAEVVG